MLCGDENESSRLPRQYNTDYEVHFIIIVMTTVPSKFRDCVNLIFFVSLYMAFNAIRAIYLCVNELFESNRNKTIECDI